MIELRDCQHEIEDLCRQLWPGSMDAPTVAPLRVAHQRPTQHRADEVVLDRMFRSKNGAVIRSLYDGDTSAYGGDDSRADLALCSHLAFWTNGDTEQIDRLFRGSGLFREKWEREDYRMRTIGKALEDTGRRGFAQSRGAIFPRVTRSDPALHSDQGEAPWVLGQPDPQTGQLVLSPHQTLPTAEAYIREFASHVEGRTLHSVGGQIVEWRNNRFTRVEEDRLRQRLHEWLHAALRPNRNRKTGAPELVDFDANPTTVGQALETIRAHVHLPASTVSPSWLDSDDSRLPAHELLPCRSMTLHIPSGRVLEPTPALFTLNALEFDYDAHAPRPDRWLAFLDQLFGDDTCSKDMLQEWMGYCLTADTSQQKMLLLVGPRRSGKGTIGRILTRLVGAGNVVGPTTGSLAGPFGLQPLIEKSLAIVSDARFGGENVSTVVERLLCISGEDTLTIDRKFLGSVSLKLATRFMFLTNELPRLNDASTALAGRFLVLRLLTSFYGKEDPTLTDQLLGELPGILCWAIDGWKRLRERGRFVQPESGEAAIRDIEDLASPVGAFVRERCTVGVGHRVGLDELNKVWQTWCEQEGRNSGTTKQSFGRDLLAVVPGVTRRRGSGMVPFYEGIGLRTDTPQ